jgi:hypothetical protein
MNKVISAAKLFEKRARLTEFTRTFYCIECMDKNEALGKSQIIQIYDLDNDGTLRVGFPCNPFAGNKYFGRINECKFLDTDAIESLNKSGVKPIQTVYYHAFDCIDDIKELNLTNDIMKITMNANTFIVSNYSKIDNSVKRIRANNQINKKEM